MLSLWDWVRVCKGLRANLGESKIPTGRMPPKYGMPNDSLYSAFRRQVRVRLGSVVPYYKIGRFGCKIGRFKTGTRKNGRKRVNFDFLV